MTNTEVLDHLQLTHRDDLDNADHQKMDRAARYINSKMDDAANALIDIGKYLLAEFFQDDIQLFRSRGSRKSVSLRKLADRDDIILSFSSLCNAVHLAIQERRFFAHNGTFKRLSASHKLILLRVQNDHEKIQFAKKTIEENLSVRQLRAELVIRGIILPRGRTAHAANRKKRLAKPVRNIVDLVKPVSALIRANFDDVDMNIIPSSDRVFLKESAMRARDRLTELIQRL
ncbi:hypothetical protein JXA80_06680 [bacterium]|nr:hypothetical protein [candidate division CSSED10-310 bacterium]